MKCSEDEVEQLIQQLQHSDWEIRFSAVKALGKKGDKRALGPLLRVYFDPSSSLPNHFYGSITQSLSFHLNRAMPDWPNSEEARRLVPEFISALQHKDWRVRLYAADVLGRIGDRRAVDPLLQNLQEDHPDDIRRAASALGKIGDIRAVEPLIAALHKVNTWTDCTTSHYITEALGELGDSRAVQPLIAKLQEKRKPGHTGNYGSIARALGQLRDAQAIEPLIKFTRVGRSPKFGVVVNTLFEIVELLLFFIPTSDSIGEGLRALKLILASNKPLLHSYPHLLCSQCWFRAKRHYGWPAFYHRITYVTCRNCGSSRHLIPGVSKVTGVIGGSFKDLVIADNHATAPLWSEEKKMARIADINYLDIQTGGVSNYSEAINRLVKTFQEQPLNDGALLKKVVVKVQRGVDLNKDVLKILNEYFKGVILE